MKHWQLLGEAAIPGTPKSLLLFSGKDDYSIRISGGYELMNTRKHASEDALGDLACKRLRHPDSARVLVGGLGMGFTLAAVLSAVGPGAEVTVAELIPEVVEWNLGPLGERSGYPLNDPRVQVYAGDVAKLLKKKRAAFDVIALDIDNGPEGLMTRINDWVYSFEGVVSTLTALKPQGVVAYWSAGPDVAFLERLRRVGLSVEEVRVRAHGKKGARHFIWLATTAG